MELSVKHKKFADEYIRTGDAVASYKAAYPKAKTESARVESYNFLQKPTIKEYLKNINDKIHSLTEKKVTDALSNKEVGRILNAIERKEILTKIALGEIPLKKPMVCNGEIVEIDVVPDWMDRKNAIAELNRMDGEYAPEKKQIETNDLRIISPPNLLDE